MLCFSHPNRFLGHLNCGFWKSPSRVKIFSKLCLTLWLYTRNWVLWLVPFVWHHLLCVTFVYATFFLKAKADKCLSSQTFYICLDKCPTPLPLHWRQEVSDGIFCVKSTLNLTLLTFWSSSTLLWVPPPHPIVLCCAVDPFPIMYHFHLPLDVISPPLGLECTRHPLTACICSWMWMRLLLRAVSVWRYFFNKALLKKKEYSKFYFALAKRTFLCLNRIIFWIQRNHPAIK